MKPEMIARLAHTEAETLIKWLAEHFKTCTKGDVILKMGGCAIGTNHYVQCDCGLSRDITDYELW